MSKRITFPTILVTLLFSFASCTSKDESPLRQAIVDKVEETNPYIESFFITKLQVESSVTLADELARRQSIFNGKAKHYGKEAEKYRRKNMPVNAKKNADKQKEALAVIDRFNAYHEAHAAQMDSVIYFILRMNGFGYSVDETKIEIEDYYVTASPTGVIYSIQSPQGNPVLHMGVTIPNYFTEILGHEPEGEQEQNASEKDVD